MLVSNLRNRKVRQKSDNSDFTIRGVNDVFLTLKAFVGMKNGIFAFIAPQNASFASEEVLPDFYLAVWAVLSFRKASKMLF